MYWQKFMASVKRNVLLTGELDRAVGQMAIANNTSRASIVRMAVAKFFAEQGQEQSSAA